MTSGKDILNNLYNVLIESNLSRNDSEILSGKVDMDDNEISETIALIRRLNVKAKADLNRMKYEKAQELMADFINKSGPELDHIITKMESNPEFESLVAFFRNYKSLSESDKKSMLLDQKMLDFIKKAKDFFKKQ